MEGLELLRAKGEPVQAFGKVYMAEQWAKMLNMSFNLFTYLHKDCRKTVEEIYQLQGIEFSAPKRGARMQDTLRQMSVVMIQSGYKDLTQLDAERIPGSPSHRITMNGEIVGRYFYNDGRLVMENGEGVRITDMGEGEPRVQRVGGVWRLHPDTKLAIINNAARRGRA